MEWYYSDTIILMAMTLRLSEKLDADLDALASERGVSKQRLIITAIEDFLARNDHQARITSATRELMEHHSGLLDDLSRT